VIRPHVFHPGLDLIPVILGPRFHSAARADHTGMASPPHEFSTASAKDTDQFVHGTLFPAIAVTTDPCYQPRPSRATRNTPLKNAHLLRFAHPSSLRRTDLYASFLGISQALHSGMSSQPVNIGFFNTLVRPLWIGLERLPNFD